MSDQDYPAEFIDGRTNARGRLHVIDMLVPEKTALLVIDMQNFFVEQGQALEVPAARALAPNINRLTGAVRKAGGTVIWIKMTLNDEDLDQWSMFPPFNGSRLLWEALEKNIDCNMSFFSLSVCPAQKDHDPQGQL